jgi:antitoxin component YwqK of YwqJK toxin-antitoxin module
MVASYNRGILEASIKERTKENPGIASDPRFVQASAKSGSKSLFNIKFNYTQLNNFLSCFMDDPGSMAVSLSQSMKYTCLDFNLENEQITFEGYTNLNDSISSYQKAMLNVEPGNYRAWEVLSTDVGLYFSLAFEDFGVFYDNLINEFARDTSEYESITERVEKVEKFLGISIQDDFFSWIGNEIAYVMMRPSGTKEGQEVMVAVHAKDIDDARTGMDNLTRQIKRRTPAKFRAVTHLGYEINYLDIKGFFRLFLGKLFEKLEKPYYTYIGDYVIFSNSPESLMALIQQYVNGNTLKNQPEFMALKEQFSSKGNVSIFVLMQNMYSYLHYFGDDDTRSGLKKNRDLIVGFIRTGFQMVQEKGMYSTKMIAVFDDSAVDFEKLENIRSAEADVSNLMFEGLFFKTDSVFSGEAETMEIKTDDGKILQLLNLKNGRPHGETILFDAQERRQWIVNYNEGAVEGWVIKLYPDGKKWAEAQFEEDQMEGEYIEYFQNESVKMRMNYKNGEARGEVLYYYPFRKNQD